MQKETEVCVHCGSREKTILSDVMPSSRQAWVSVSCAGCVNNYQKAFSYYLCDELIAELESIKEKAMAKWTANNVIEQTQQEKMICKTFAKAKDAGAVCRMCRKFAGRDECPSPDDARTCCIATEFHRFRIKPEMMI